MDIMTRYLILYAACTAIFFPLDFIWLSLTAKNLYRRELGDLLLQQPNFAIAAGFYLAYIAGMVILAAAPADGDLLKALFTGAVLGFVAYGTYDLTNLSTVRGFTPTIAVVDMAWGTILSALTATGGVWISRWFV